MAQVFQHIKLLEQIALEVTTMGVEEVPLKKKVINANGKGIVRIRVTDTYTSSKTGNSVYITSINKHIAFFDAKNKLLFINDEVNTLTKVLLKLRQENTVTIGTKYHELIEGRLAQTMTDDPDMQANFANMLSTQFPKSITERIVETFVEEDAEEFAQPLNTKISNLLAKYIEEVNKRQDLGIDTSWLQKQEAEFIKNWNIEKLAHTVAIKSVLDNDKTPVIVSRNETLAGLTQYLYTGSTGDTEANNNVLDFFRHRTIDIYIKDYPKEKPTKTGQYLVYRASCNKLHFAAWNGTQWGYDNNAITNWIDVTEIKTKLKRINDEKD